MNHTNIYRTVFTEIIIIIIIIIIIQDNVNSAIIMT